jgi:hypothetical protein
MFSKGVPVERPGFTVCFLFLSLSEKKAYGGVGRDLVFELQILDHEEIYLQVRCICRLAMMIYLLVDDSSEDN